MLTRDQVQYAKFCASKVFSADGWKRLARNPMAAYHHIRRFFFDINLRYTPAAGGYDDALSSLATVAMANNAGRFEEWLPLRDDQDIADLGALFRKQGSDKASAHDYYRVYGSILGHRRHKPLNILEIGLGTNNIDIPSNMGPSGRPGASLRAFRDWAPAASVYGADVDPRILFSEDRIQTEWVDQTDRASLAALASKLHDRSFDLIIDDGLHLPHANMNTINALLPLLSDSGTLVVEDINGHYAFWTVALNVFSKEWDCFFAPTKSAHIFVVRRRTITP